MAFDALARPGFPIPEDAEGALHEGIFTALAVGRRTMVVRPVLGTG